MGVHPDSKEIIKWFAALPRPAALVILRALFERGLVDPHRIEEPAYLWPQVWQHRADVTGDIEIMVSWHADLIDAAEDALDVDRPAVALILIVTAVEHILNLHYRDALAKKGLDEKQIRQALHAGFTAKLGWMLPVAGLPTLEQRLLKQLRVANELRNSLVHYKARPLRGLQQCDEWADLKQKLAALDFDALVDAVDELEYVLSWGLIGVSEYLQLAVKVYDLYLDGTNPAP